MSKAKYTLRRRRATMNTIPAEQSIVEVLRNGYVVANMGRWSTLCLAEGAINALAATDEQILRAYQTDESVFA